MSLRKYWNAECDNPRHPRAGGPPLPETGGFQQIDGRLKRFDVIRLLARCGWRLDGKRKWSCASCVATEPVEGDGR